MKLKVDYESDALYLRLDDSQIVESEGVQSGVILDFDAQGHVNGIEMLRIRMQVALEALKTLQFETA